MTPDQIERAARELCKMRGHAPDVAAEYLRTEVERFAQVGTAIAAVMQREAGGVATKTPRRKKVTKGA